MAEQGKIFSNYFDDENTIENKNEKLEKESNSILNIKKNQKEKIIKLTESEIENKIIGNPQKIQKYTQSDSKLGEELKTLDYKFSVPKTKKKNNCDSKEKLNSENTTQKNENIVKGELSSSIEYFENIDDLMDSHGDDSMEYELLDFNDLSNYLNSGNGLDLDYKPVNLDPEKQVENLEKLFKEDPLNYETLYKLIYLYRDLKNTEKLKYFREYTQSYFPISDDMWKEWIKDELIEINKNNHDKFELKVQLIDLFERALRDFYYIKISKRFLKFLIFLKKEKESKYPEFVVDQRYSDYLTICGIRKKFENILDIWGLDFNLSQKIWDLYIEFEEENKKIFMLNKNTEEANKTDILIRSIFRRRLSFPHIDLDIVWKEYKKRWENESEQLEKMEEKYKQSSQKCEEFINFEEKFYELIEVAAKENSAGKLEMFLKIEIPKISKKYFNYAKLYFEKALEFNCDNFEIWKMYIEHTKNFAKNNEWLISIMFRSCKCCFFCVDLWKGLILEMERNFYNKVDIQKKLQEAYQSVEEKDEKSEIWIFSIVFNCRNYFPKYKSQNNESNKENINIEDLDYNKIPQSDIYEMSEIDEELEQIRFDFKNLIESLRTEKNYEILCNVYKLWAEFETYKIRSKKKMEEVMNDLLKIDSSPDSWLDYISYQKYFGDIVSIRKTYKRSIEYCKVEKKALSEKWLEWESLLGTITDIEYAEKYLKNKKLDDKKNPLTQSRKFEKNSLKKFSKLGKKSKNIIKTSEYDKNAVYSSDKDNIIDDENQAFMDGYDQEETYQDIELSSQKIKKKKGGLKFSEDKKIRKKKTTNIVSNYSEEAIKQELNLSLEENSNEDRSLLSEEYDIEQTKHDRTLIIKNLEKTINEEELQQFIIENSPAVLIEDIRIVRDKKGFSKGFAFVDFTNKFDAEKCLKELNGKKIEELEVSCAISKPPSLGENDKRTIFVNNLPFNITKEGIKEIFSKFGDILDIRIILDKETNLPKGYCYIEFLKEDSVESVLQNKKSFSIGERKIFVKRSQSIVKLRENIKNVLFISNLHFAVKEDDLKGFFEKENIKNIVEILIVRDEKDKSKGYGFIEFDDEENMQKALELKGAIIKGRTIVIKKSNRNITTNKKRLRESEHETNQVDIEDKSDVKWKKFKKFEFTDNSKEKSYKKKKEKKLNEDIGNILSNVNIENFQNKNFSYSQKENNNKKSLKNEDFRKFLNK